MVRDLAKGWAFEEAGWEDQFAEHGFVIVRGVVEPELCRRGMERVRQIVPGLPDDPRDWECPKVATLHKPYFGEAGQSDPGGLDDVLDSPRLRAAIERVFGGPGHYNGQKNYYLFLRAFDPKAKAALSETGHIDFGNQPIPALYRGFVVQLMLHDSEPFSGNLTLHPGTHKYVQKRVIDEPTLQIKSGVMTDAPPVPPVEFVGKAGDICFMHHLVFHSGNQSHAAGRTPRVALMIEAFRDKWLESIDPAKPGLSAWEKSLAFNGPYRELRETLESSMKRRADYYETLKKTPGEGRSY